jgi:hypothetical protein
MVDYCTNTLGQNDIIQWLRAYRSRQPDQGEKYFLFGHNETEPDSPNPMRGTANIGNRNVQFIFPCIAAIFEQQANARSDIDSKETSYYAEINGIKVPPSANKRLDADAEGVDRFMDGYWVCVSNLSDGDVIRFGGTGPRRFTTEAIWTVRVR